MAHYRSALYRRLDENKDVSFVHWSDDRVLEGIGAINAANLQDFKRIRNMRFRRLLWQRGVLKAALDKSIDRYIFTGNVNYVSTWITALVARIRRKPVYFWTIGWHRREAGPRRLLRLSFYRIANRLLVYTEVEKQRAIEHGYPEQRISVVYNSVPDVENIDWEKVQSWAGRTAVGAIARLKQGKSFHLLIEAAATLKNQGRDIKLIFGGDGPERRRLEQLSADLGIRCCFLGEISAPGEIEAFYREVGLTVVPTAAGLTTIQSLAYGAPVITDDDDQSQMPEASAIRPGRTGSRYAAGSVESLANEIDSWLERRENDPQKIVADCLTDVQTQWTPMVQAARILEAVQKS